MSTFFLVWQDPDARRWYPVGRLDRLGGWYLFAYTKAAQMSPRFVPFGNLGDRYSIYLSQVLFPIFANRVLSEKRPEYSTYARWTGFQNTHTSDPLMLMARMGGTRATDTLQVYPMPERTEAGEYRTVFFAHGLSHLQEQSQERTFRLHPGDRLFPMLDVQNTYDSQAVALRTTDPSCLVGYCPRHLAPDIKELSRRNPEGPEVRVKQINPDAPPQYRLLCEAVAPWPHGFTPCAGEEYKTIVPYDPHEVLAQHTGWQAHSVGTRW